MCGTYNKYCWAKQGNKFTLLRECTSHVLSKKIVLNSILGDMLKIGSNSTFNNILPTEIEPQT